MSARGIVERAQRWLGERGSAEPVWIVAGSLEAARALVQGEVARRGAVLGWECLTLDAVAVRLARPAIVERGLQRATPIALEALVAELIRQAASAGALGRFAPLVGRAGLARSLSRTLAELREADAAPIDVSEIDAELGALLRAYGEVLAQGKRVDRPRLFELATSRLSPRLGDPTAAGGAAAGGAAAGGAAAGGAAAGGAAAGGAAAWGDGEGGDPGTLDVPALLLLDVPVATRVEADLVMALVRRSACARVFVRAWDRRSLAALGERVAGALELVGGDTGAPRTGPQGVADQLFEGSAAGVAEAGLDTFSAATEYEECLEIAARIQEHAAAGTRYANVAVLLRDPAGYRAPLESALERAGIPFALARGARRPDPSGRALLSLIDCALEGLSARAFAEYLSFSVLPDSVMGAPPEALARGDQFVESEGEREGEGEGEREGKSLADDEPPVESRRAATRTEVRAGTLAAPRRFEALLTDAAVIGGAERWARRLAGLRAGLVRQQTELDEPDGARGAGITADIADLDALTRFALPLIADLSALPAAAALGEHCDKLAALATRALSRPNRVLSVLAEVALSGGSDRTLEEVRQLLAPRLVDVTREASVRGGTVSLLSIDEARGRAFDVVFLPGLSDGAFPRRVVEDAILRDEAREKISADLARRHTRIDEERARLRLAVSSARVRIIASHPRLDAERSRPRVPSLYLLELVRAATGALPAVNHAAPPAARTTLGVPADPARAIDATEHDVARVGSLLARAAAGESGLSASMRYVVEDPSEGGRAVRRAMEERWLRGGGRFEKKFTAADGVATTAAGKAALAKHTTSERTLSASALEGFVACPYRFFLSSILRLSARDTREPLLELDPLLRGSIVHSLQFQWLTRMRDAGLFPLQEAGVEAALKLLSNVVAQERVKLHEDLYPALPRAFDDEIDRLHADLRRWVSSLAGDAWQPAFFELGFGGPRGDEHDAASVKEPVRLEGVGITLRGSIDLVERRVGADDEQELVRATDHKTGRSYHRAGTRIGGGHALQPVLYALALEKLLPDAKVEGGRLYYCTTRGGFSDVVVPLDDDARAAAGRVAAALDAEMLEGRVVRWPQDENTCAYCDYQVVCGTDEPRRASEKRRAGVSLPLLDAVRSEK